MVRASGRRYRTNGLWHLVLLLLGHIVNCHAQLSKPVAADKHWQEQDNKFLSRKATNDKPDDAQEFDDLVEDNICPLDVELKWMTEISSSVYATPLITDLYADGRKDIIVPGFVHYTEVLEGPDGAKALGWPGFHRSTVHSSPLLYDIDYDGIRDILVATYDGEIVFFKDNGEQLHHRLMVPRLRVRKNWYVGINPDPVDHSHPDVGKGAGENNLYEKAVHGGKKQEQLKQQEPKQPPPKPQQQQQNAASTPQAAKQQPQQQPATPVQALIPATQQQQQKTVSVPIPQPAQQPPQQQQQQGTSGSTAPPLAAADGAAVLKFRQQLQEYTQQYGQAAADAMLNKVKESNKAMYDAVTSQIAKEKELEQLVASFGTAGHQQQQQQQQEGTTGQIPATAAATGQQGVDVAHARRKLLSVSDQQEDQDQQQQQQQEQGQELDSTSSSNRHLLQAANAAEGGAPVAAGVESNPTQKPLTQEAVDSFKVFEDDAGVGSTAQQQQQQQQQQQTTEPEDTAEAAAVGVDAAAGQTADQQQQQENVPYPYTYDDDLLRGHEYDELGDKWGPGTGDVDQQKDGQQQQNGQQQQEGQQQQQEGGVPDGQGQGLRDLGDDSYGWKGDMWDDEMFRQAAHTFDTEYIYLDAHILSTPAIADIDADGNDELVIAVSYFYDAEYYDDPLHAQELKGIDKDKYVAGGIVVFDLRTRLLKWQQHLDLTTATTKFTAHMFSAPTLVDIDACGKMEIVVGTSVGFVYVLDHKGNSRTGWPVQMGEVQGQVLVADLNADGNIEIFAGDMLGNIALFDINGKEIWEQHVKSAITQNAVAGDINADGLLEIVFGTADGKVHAVRGTDGRPIANFPFQTGGRVNAPPTITHLKKGSTHQHILIMSFDGFLYLIDGNDGCAHTVDIGESSYSAVLVDDLCGDGMMELLVSTMNGNVYMLQTTSPYHPAKTWTAQIQGINGMVSRWGYFGFVATPGARQLRDVAGQHLQVQVELWDQRTMLDHGVPMEDPPRGPYNITVMLKGVGVAEMNAGPQPVIGVSDVIDKPGKAVIEIPCPRTRTTAAVTLDLATKHGLHYQDEFYVSFHMHFYKLLKWLVALPLLAMAAAAVIIGQTMGFDSGRSYYLG